MTKRSLVVLAAAACMTLASCGKYADSVSQDGSREFRFYKNGSAIVVLVHPSGVSSVACARGFHMAPTSVIDDGRLLYECEVNPPPPNEIAAN
jgi:hypothetical protein